MSDQGKSISSTQSMVLDLPPSCIEFCPSCPSYFVVGTYYLEKTEHDVKEAVAQDDDEEQAHAKPGQPQNRNGSIIVFQMKDKKAIPIQTVPQPSAVFDLHFEPHKGREHICAAVSSTGSISFFELKVPSNDKPATGSDTLLSEPLRTLSVLRVPDLDEATLFTYFTWHPTIPGLMAITTAAGQVVVVQIHKDYTGLNVIDPAALEHSLEAWVVAFTPASNTDPSTTLLSGGDDSALNYTTLSASHDKDSPEATQTFPYTPITNRNIHTAGVTAILPLSLPNHVADDHLILTGSYDDNLRLLRVKPLHNMTPGRPVTVLAEQNLGGGVWRLNVVGSPVVNHDDGRWEVTVLVSCMHAGTRVVRICGGGDGDVEAEICVLARFEEHKSMNYGSDWSREESRLGGDMKEVVCVSTSFYDRLLCVWSFQEECGGSR